MDIKREQWIKEAEDAEKNGYVTTCQAIAYAVRPLKRAQHCHVAKQDTHIRTRGCTHAAVIPSASVWTTRTARTPGWRTPKACAFIYRRIIILVVDNLTPWFFICSSFGVRSASRGARCRPPGPSMPMRCRYSRLSRRSGCGPLSLRRTTARGTESGQKSMTRQVARYLIRVAMPFDLCAELRIANRWKSCCSARCGTARRPRRSG